MSDCNERKALKERLERLKTILNERIRTHTNVENVCERKQSKNIVSETSEEVALVLKRKYK